MRSLQPQRQQQDWVVFFKVNCAALFETALLLTADPKEAEATLTGTLDDLDVSSPPDGSELTKLRDELARRVIHHWQPSASSADAEASSMLQEGLRPILQIDRRPRMCFVLRMLLGYAASTCAQMLEIDEYTVAALVGIAILQLTNAVSQTRSLQEKLVRRMANVTSH